MKTTVEIADSLLAEARKVAAREQTTVKALVEEGLRRALAERQHGSAFRLRKATFPGRGLQAGVSEGSWERIRGLIYEGRGA
ncbi:MAG TPA: type II toxin-antitoxin system VapB family antitoxin [Vicinamibacteria bacterium]|nr:type II toxin-antitoxin system VapB family antitoxin [Vicinamibacteria bacterium]